MIDEQYTEKMLMLMQRQINNLQAELLKAQARELCTKEDNQKLEKKLAETNDENVKLAESISKLKSRNSKLKNAKGVKEEKEESQEDDGFVSAEYVEVDTKKSARK